MRTTLFLVLLAVAGCGSDAEPENGTGGQAPGGSGGGGSGGSGGSGGDDGDSCTPGGDECDPQASCVFTDGTCGEGDPNRHCEYLAPTCGESPLQTVCGCDGKTRAANCVVGDIDTRPGACPAPEGQFWCGELACNHAEQFCQLEFEAFCQPLPADCQACDCLEPLPGGCMCKAMDDGHLEVSCFVI